MGCITSRHARVSIWTGFEDPLACMQGLFRLCASMYFQPLAASHMAS